MVGELATWDARDDVDVTHVVLDRLDLEAQDVIDEITCVRDAGTRVLLRLDSPDLSPDVAWLIDGVVVAGDPEDFGFLHERFGSDFPVVARVGDAVPARPRRLNNWRLWLAESHVADALARGWRRGDMWVGDDRRAELTVDEPTWQDTLWPSPVLTTMNQGTLDVSRVRISGPEDLCDIFRAVVGGVVQITSEAPIEVTLAYRETLRPEEYLLTITDYVRIAAADAAGAVWACQTLRQLMPDAAGLPGKAPGPLEIQRCFIQDRPRYRWRGMHLDVARHFHPISWLFRMVDVASMHKLNVLHLHLTDDQGWRFEVKGYPRLTTVGAFRPATTFARDDFPVDRTPVGGFYTQDQLRSLVAYAHARGITVVPEVDVPGHVRSLLAAYPEYGAGQHLPVADTNDIFDEVLELTDHTLEMVSDVFTQLLDVFDSPVIHIGGDECPKTQWQGNPASKQRADELGLDSVDELQTWFTRWLVTWLADHGRRAIGWDEITGDVDDAVIMAWRGEEFATEAAKQGHDVVCAPVTTTYYDYYQSSSSLEPYAIGGNVSWRDIVQYDPLRGIPAEQRHHIQGVQGQVWGEYITSTRQAEYMAFPRMSVLAEIGWSGRIQWPVDVRLRRQIQRLQAAGVEVRPLDGPLPWQAGGHGLRGRPVKKFDVI